MNTYNVRRSALLAAGLGSVLALAACEDKRVKELNSGITQDSALKIIRQDAKPPAPNASGTMTTDSFPNVYTREQYLVAGKRYDVLYFTPENDKEKKLPFGQPPMKKADSIPYRRLTPIVFVDNKLAGRGWDFWDSASKALKIPVKSR